jgi:Fe-S-cluster containining protein
MGRRSRARRGPPSPCRGCGRCCEEFGDTLAAEERDLERWRREGRSDLLGLVGEGGGLWVAPETGAPLDRCPFLVRTGPETAHCAIHATKPDMCRAYPTRAHGFHCAAGIRFSRPPRGGE